MILKLKDHFDSSTTDRLIAAGNKAEEQMAFYLKRAFSTEPNVYVFHDLRLAADNADDFAQIDHLVLFSRGMVVIESKSVTSKVKINELGEWSRYWDGRWSGFPSPSLQAKRQTEFLNNLLFNNRDKIRRKLLGAMQLSFGMFPMDILVAISDNGTIDREGNHPEVMKADQVTERIKEIIKKRDVSFLSWALKSKSEEK